MKMLSVQYTPPKDWRFRTHNLKVPSFGEFLLSLCVGSVLWCVETLKIFKVPLCVGPVLYRDIARTFPVQKSCAAFFAGTDSCLFPFSNGTKTCLFVFAGALKRLIGKKKKKHF